MSKIVKVTDGDYKIVVSNGASGTITLDTTAGAAGTRGKTIIKGDLEVQGETTTVESTVTTIADNIITINEGQTGTGISAVNNYIAGIEIDRGSLVTARIVWNEQGDFYTGGSSGQGSFRLEDINGSLLPLITNSINAESTLYITTPGSHIDISGTVNYERSVFNYVFDGVAGDYVITDPGSGPVINNDSLPNTKGVVDYVAFALANNLQPGIEDGDTSVRTEDFDTTALESTVKVTVDGSIISNFYSNRLEVADVKIQNNEISTINSNEDLLLSAPGTGSVTAKDVFALTGSPWDDDATMPSAPATGVKLYATNNADTEGNVGVFFVNNNSVRDELVSKNRALLYGMLF